MSGAGDRALQAELARLRAANEDLQEFVRVVSHDLQAPVRAIANLADWLLEDHAESVGDPEARRLLELLGVRVRNLSRMIEGLLRYSRATTADLEVGDLVPADIAGRALAACDTTGVVLDAAWADGTVATSARMLREAVGQLVDNAVRAARAGGGHVRIDLACGEDTIRLTVADDGPGVAEHLRSRLFRVFETGEPAAERQRAGVGLAIVRKLAARLGGRIWFSGAPAGGAVFSVEWPRVLPANIQGGEGHA